MGMAREWPLKQVRLIRGWTMQRNIIDRLFQSFTDLEGAINGAKRSLRMKEHISKDVLDRLDSYDDILKKQRDLAGQLCQHINNKEWDEVNRHVALINSLSAMIRDDARAILSSLSANSDNQEDVDYSFC